MKQRLTAIGAIFVTSALVGGTAGQQVTYRTLDDRFPAPRYSSVQEWQARGLNLRTHILASAGLVPLPEKTPLNATVFGDVTRDDYIVSRVYFESLPGFYVTGNLYRPATGGPPPRSCRRTGTGRTAGSRTRRRTPVRAAPSASRARDSSSLPTT